MWNMNSGYHGFSMSNRAIEAYNNGEKPFSKWTKQDILDVIEEYKQESDDPTVHLFYTVFYELAKVRAGVLKAHLLRKSSWHHTGKFYKKTEFYRFEFDPKSWDQEQIDYCVALKKGEKKQKKENNYITARIKYHFRTGTRKHPIYNSEEEIVRFRSSDGKMKTKNGNKTAKVAPFITPAIERVASKKPEKSAPESPINIFAGLKLKVRNASIEPAKINAIKAVFG